MARVVGPYSIYDEIACGGMATVHLAHEVTCAKAGSVRTVAIKEPHPHLRKDPEFLPMFLDEARLAAHVEHPNVVRLLDVVATPSDLFLVLEYVHGVSLAALLRVAAAPIEPSLAVGVLVQLLAGLHAAHEARDANGAPLAIVHRDVSPQNVLVALDGRVCLLDFGIAKAAGRLRTTREGGLRGKLAYMPPEQARAAPVTRAADIYAASIVLWEALTGRRLFAGENEAAVLEQVLLSFVDPPSRHTAALPAALDDVVLRGLASDPSKRFPTAQAMADALAAAVEPASVDAIAAWVGATAGEALAERARGLAEVAERTRDDAPRRAAEMTTASFSGRTPGVESRRRTRAWAFGGAAFFATVSVLAVAFAHHRLTRDGSMAPPLAREPTAAAIVEPPPAVAPAPLEVVTPPPERSSATPPPPSPAKRSIPRDTAASRGRAHAPSAPAAKHDCSVPYGRDADGRKLYWLDCLPR